MDGEDDSGFAQMARAAKRLIPAEADRQLWLAWRWPGPQWTLPIGGRSSNGAWLPPFLPVDGASVVLGARRWRAQVSARLEPMPTWLATALGGHIEGGT